MYIECTFQFIEANLDDDLLSLNILTLSGPEHPIEPLAPIVIQVLSDDASSHPCLRLQGRDGLRQG